VVASSAVAFVVKGRSTFGSAMPRIKSLGRFLTATSAASPRWLLSGQGAGRRSRRLASAEPPPVLQYQGL